MKLRFSSTPILAITAAAVLSGCATNFRPPPCQPWTPPPSNTWQHDLTLDHAVQLATSSDVNIADWCARQQAAHAELVNASVLPNPVLGFTLEDIGLKDPSSGKNLMTHTTDLTYSFSKLITRADEIRAAQAGQQKSAADVAESRRQVTKSVGETFYKILAEQELVEVAQKDFNAAKDMENAAAQRVVVGEGSEYEADRAKAERLGAERDLDLARRTLALDQLTFAFQLGADQPAWPHLSGKWPALNPGQKIKARPTDAQINAALAARPDYAKVIAARYQAEATLTAEQKRGIIPGDPNVSAGRKSAPEGHSSVLGISLPLPIFDRNQGGISKAEAELATAQTEEERIRREVISDLSQAKSRSALATSQSGQFARPIVSLREDLFEKSRKLFEAGELPYTDLQQSYRELLTARHQELEARRDAAIADWQAELASAR